MISFLIPPNTDGHEHGLKKAHQIVVGPEFDDFPEFHHLPQRYATVPWFGSSFQIITPKSGYVLYSTTENEGEFYGSLMAHNDLNDESEETRFQIEPGFHRNSVVIKDFEGRKLGIDHVNSSFTEMGITLQDTVTHIASYSWFVYSNKWGNHNGLILESMKHEYVLSIDADWEPFIMHKSLMSDYPEFEGFRFRKVNYSQYERHQELLKDAKEKWHDNVHKV